MCDNWMLLSPKQLRIAFFSCETDQNRLYRFLGINHTSSIQPLSTGVLDPFLIVYEFPVFVAEELSGIRIFLLYIICMHIATKFFLKFLLDSLKLFFRFFVYEC